jgi:hypothetical protein
VTTGDRALLDHALARLLARALVADVRRGEAENDTDNLPGRQVEPVAPHPEVARA